MAVLGIGRLLLLHRFGVRVRLFLLTFYSQISHGVHFEFRLVGYFKLLRRW